MTALYSLYNALFDIKKGEIGKFQWHVRIDITFPDMSGT